MLLRLVNQRARRIVKLPKSNGGDRPGTTKYEMNSITADARLKQGIADESLYRQVCWNSIHTRGVRSGLTHEDRAPLGDSIGGSREDVNRA